MYIEFIDSNDQYSSVKVYSFCVFGTDSVFYFELIIPSQSIYFDIRLKLSVQ